MPYTRELVPNSDGTWFARILEFPGCMTEGDTQAEAIDMLGDAMDAWISAKLEDNEPIPDPIASEEYSGKFVARVPKSLHRDLARRADLEGVSLNQHVVATLARHGA
jgi:antitoxin HicB